MNQQISILAHTHKKYSENIFLSLGKGKIHASLLYKEWHQTGCMTTTNPAFKNASFLQEQIEKATYFFHMPLIKDSIDNETRKLIFKTKEEYYIETVLIPMKTGWTVCISSQVGCSRGCAFCETGKMGLWKSLSVEEIVYQVKYVVSVLGVTVKNIVFMGMGEPFDNIDAVFQAIEVFSDPLALNIPESHITVSTSGIIPGIDKLTALRSKVNLAISLHGFDEYSRSKLMPINKVYPLSDLLRAMENYYNQIQKQILIEYILIKGITDTEEAIEKLISLLQGFPVKLNLIPYNSQRKSRFETSSLERVNQCCNKLRESGFRVLLRQTKGDKIMAACGQLGGRFLRKNYLVNTREKK